MKLGILLCDDHYPDSIPIYGHYDDAFKRMFEGSLVTAVDTYRCFENEFPDSPHTCDLWLVTGSKWGVYDQDPWITQAAAFVQTCYQENVPLLGVCFGHQLIHHALGGTVEKSDKGWGMGVYPIKTKGTAETFSVPDNQTLNLIACHQDQVIEPAPALSVVAGSTFCPVAITHQQGKVLTMQCHPEFTPSFILQLIDRLREKADNDVIDRAINSVHHFGEGDRCQAISLIFEFCQQLESRYQVNRNAAY